MAASKTAGGDGQELLIKRYASRRLYNTETSDYVTLDDIAAFIRAGRDVRIVDLKSGDDLTRSYLLQIISEHETRGDNVLPLGVLTDLVRSYTGAAQSVVPEFLQASFEMLRSGQSKMIENLTAMNPMAQMPGVRAMQDSQRAFLEAMTGGMAGGLPGWGGGATAPKAEGSAEPTGEESREELDAIRKQLADMQAVLAKMNKT